MFPQYLAIYEAAEACTVSLPVTVYCFDHSTRGKVRNDQILYMEALNKKTITSKLP